MSCLNEYHEWLVSLIDSPNKDLHYHYQFLMDILDNIPFEPNNLHDENLFFNVDDMRDEYVGEFCGGNLRKWDEIQEKQPSFLEIFVAMLVKISDFVLVDPGDPSVAPDIWYEIMCNTDFLALDDEHFDLYGQDFVKNRVKSYVKNPRKCKIFGVDHEERQDIWTNLNHFCTKKYF